MFLFAGTNYKPALTYEMQVGTPVIKSITALTFGPDGILFLGDSQNASVVSIDTKGTKLNKATKSYNLQQIDQEIAEVLGTTKENINELSFRASRNLKLAPWFRFFTSVQEENAAFRMATLYSG